MLKKFLNKFLVFFAVLVVGFFIWLYQQYTVPIIMYHNIEDVGEHRANWTTPQKFEYQMRYLKEHHYNVISLDEFILAKRENKKLPRNSVVLTFDDGVDSNYTSAFAILKEFNLPATMFVPTDFIGKPGHMTLEQLKEMMQAGIEIASHSITHRYLPDLNPAEQEEEVFKSKAVLEEALNTKIKYFSYPVGGFTEEVKQFVKDAGYQAALSTNRGYDRKNNDLYEIKRIRFSDKDRRDDILFIKLSGYYNTFRGLKNPY